jgi:alpha-mannosidase
MTPTDTYNAQCDYSELMKGVRGHKNLAVTDKSLLLYGNGDGGGGPTPRMLEKVSASHIVREIHTYLGSCSDSMRWLRSALKSRL